MVKKSLLVTITTIALVGVVGYFAIYTAVTWIRGLDSDVAAAVITAMIGLFGLWYAQWQIRAREISESHRQSKIQVYNIFFDIVDKFQDDFISTPMEKPEDVPASLKKEFRRLNRGLILWGSPEVMRAWLTFRAIAGHGDTRTLIAVDNMYRAIRKDLGNSNFGLQSGDLIKSTLSDPENWGK